MYKFHVLFMLEVFLESVHIYEWDNDWWYTNFLDLFRRSEARVNSL